MFSSNSKLFHHSYYIHRISHDIKIRRNTSLKKYDLTDSQIKVMFCLWQKDCVSQVDIQKFINIKPSSLTRLIDQLENKKFISRITCEKDSRIKLIKLTDKGKQLEKDTWDTIMYLENLITKDFTQEEKKLALSFLKKMLSNISTERKEYQNES